MITNFKTAVNPIELRQPGLAERLIMRALRDMSVGQLKLELPYGRSQVYGNPAPAGEEPKALIRVRREIFFRRCLLYGDIGFAESYIAGDWESDDLTAVIRWFLANIDQAPTVGGSRQGASGLNLLRVVNRLAHLLRPNSVRTSRRNIAEHYDLSNNFFATFLDPSMTYSSALWTDSAMDLEAAQEAKYERLCRQLRLKATDTVLEIGCGWGSFAMYASSHYGCRVTGLTLSQAQYDWATRRVAEAGLKNQVEIRLEDYRQHQGTYTKIASIEMLEAVGHRYHPAFAKACSRLLLPGGLMALQFITYPDSRYKELRRGVDFIQKHIFPGSLLLSLNRLNGLLARNGDFWLHDLHDMGLDYAHTLREWRHRFEDSLAEVQRQGFSDAFIRKWRYYLSYCEGAFAARNISVVQATYTRPNNPALQEKLADTAPRLTEEVLP